MRFVTTSFIIHKKFLVLILRSSASAAAAAQAGVPLQSLEEQQV
jgi:hypothetical protein